MYLIIYLYLFLVFLLRHRYLPSVFVSFICTFIYSTFILLFYSCACSLFHLPVLLFLFLTLSSHLSWTKQAYKPRWAPSGWDENAGKMAGILSRLNSIKCSDRARSLRARLHAVSECPRCSTTWWMIWFSVTLQQKVGFCERSRFAPKTFGSLWSEQMQWVCSNFQDFTYSMDTVHIWGLLG